MNSSTSWCSSIRMPWSGSYDPEHSTWLMLENHSIGLNIASS